jgi:hypothetical protein
MPQSLPMERAFSPHDELGVGDLGRCPRLIWTAPSALLRSLSIVFLTEAAVNTSASDSGTAIVRRPFFLNLTGTGMRFIF